MADVTQDEAVAPTRTGSRTGIESGVRWTFESPADHWRLHDRREVEYWRSRPPQERLGQAARYRLRVHGWLEAPPRWPWRFVTRSDSEP